MCFDYDSSVPLPPLVNIPLLFVRSASRQNSGSHIELVSKDGTHFAAYQARPSQPNGAAIVVMPDIRGLFHFYEDLADRFASVGVEAVAIDYFGRTAGISVRDEQFDYMPHVMQTKPEQVAQDVASAISHLRQTANPSAIFTVGFCFGGQQSFLQAASHHGLSGVIGFYGAPASSRSGGPTPLSLINDFECPILGLFGGADQGIPVADVEKFDQALNSIGLAHEIKVYPGAPHSFFDRKYEQFGQESTDAWQRMLAFIDTYTPKATI
jgi:carboxymethylenebutenolidase